MFFLNQLLDLKSVYRLILVWTGMGSLGHRGLWLYCKATCTETQPTEPGWSTGTNKLLIHCLLFLRSLLGRFYNNLVNRHPPWKEIECSPQQNALLPTLWFCPNCGIHVCLATWERCPSLFRQYGTQQVWYLLSTWDFVGWNLCNDLFKCHLLVWFG